MKKLLTGILLIVALLAFGVIPTLAQVTTERDTEGIWYVKGPDDAPLEEVFDAVGYAVACDRLWQAETFRRAGLGRLAEIQGQEALKTDILVRTTGYSTAELEAAFAALDDESKTVITGYCNGFNRRIAEIAANPTLLPIEFAKLGIFPEPWLPIHILAWQSLMLRKFDCEATTHGQLDNAALYHKLMVKFGLDMAHAMFEDLRWANDPTALTYIDPPQGPLQFLLYKSSARTAKSAPPAFDLEKADQSVSRLYSDFFSGLKKVGADVKMGSYAWAISGKKTADGTPMLYSGPQMGFSVPPVVGEGSIEAGGLNVSGMQIAGLPGIILGRTPHHAWSMQVGHAHTVDFYLEKPEDVTFDRFETIKVKGGEDVTIPIFKSKHGPIIQPIPYDPANYQPSPDNPIIAWKYSNRIIEHGTVRAYLDLARATSPEEFGSALERVGLSQHFCYVDIDGNIAYWMSGREPVRPAAEYRFPQGFIPTLPIAEWDPAIYMPLPHVMNPEKGWIGGWNNKCSSDRPSSFNRITSTFFFGPYHRGQVIANYLNNHDNLTFEEVRDLAVNIAATDSVFKGGNPWSFVKNIFATIVKASGNQDAIALLSTTEGFDGHFCDDWALGTERSFAWNFTDAWIKEVLKLTFADELDFGDTTYLDQNQGMLFNVLLHAIAGEHSSVKNLYNWFQNQANPNAPQTLPAIVITAEFKALRHTPWFPPRGDIEFKHPGFAGTPYDPLHTTLFGSRSTYAQCIEYGPQGPIRIESMFPLGESGTILLEPNLMLPIFDPNFYSMTPYFDNFQPRPFPLFK
jgi:penicillin amidase